MVIVRTALVRVPELFDTSVMILTTSPTAKGPSVLPLASSGALWSKPGSTPSICHPIIRVVAWSPPEDGPRLRVFVSYSKSDIKAKDELLAQLKLLVQEGLIEPWHDGDIRPGEDWNEAIQKQLQEADVALCLVSNAFLTTDYIVEKEIPVMVERSQRGKCLTVPIILEKCLWTRGDLKRFNALPAKGKPIRSANPHAKAWVGVQAGLADWFEELLSKKN